MIYTLDDYNEVRGRVAEMAMPQVRRFKVQLEGGPGYTYHVQLYLPPGLREDEITTYPMVLYMWVQYSIVRLHFCVAKGVLGSHKKVNA